MTEHHLEFLSLRGGCTCSSESTHVKIPHCWISHIAAQMPNPHVPCFQAAELAIKFLGQERATTVVEIVCPRLTELRRFSAVSMGFQTARQSYCFSIV